MLGLVSWSVLSFSEFSSFLLSTDFSSFLLSPVVSFTLDRLALLFGVSTCWAGKAGVGLLPLSRGDYTTLCL